MRPDLITPGPGNIENDAVIAMLDLVGESVLPDRLKALSPLEKALVYDWAMREHLRASDNLVHARPRPWILTCGPTVAESIALYDDAVARARAEYEDSLTAATASQRAKMDAYRYVPAHVHDELAERRKGS